jgi:hypothetical protein
LLIVHCSLADSVKLTIDRESPRWYTVCVVKLVDYTFKKSRFRYDRRLFCLLISGGPTACQGSEMARPPASLRGSLPAKVSVTGVTAGGRLMIV